jgi:HD-GYP domain-containing protein (c-di-GMP phosphodiesterase class II)
VYNRFGVWQSALSTQPREKRPEGENETAPTPLSSLIGLNTKNQPYLSIPLEMIPTDTPLACSLYVRISEQFILFRKAGDTLTQSRAQALLAPSNGILFISLEEWNKLLHSLEALLIASQQTTQVSSPKELGLRIRNLLIAYAREIERSKVFSQDTLARMGALSAQLAGLLYQQPDLSKQLLKRYQDPALYYINHAVNVTIYSISIAIKQNLPLAALHSLAFSSLVHNIGNIMIPAELLYKPGELTVEEKNTVDTHILHGASLLQELYAPKEVVLTAMQHHDRYDGQGQEGRKGGNEIHLFARICSIADVYDALTSQRPHQRRPFTAQEAIQRMVEMKGKFDPTILSMIPEREDSD